MRTTAVHMQQWLVNSICLVEFQHYNMVWWKLSYSVNKTLSCTFYFRLASNRPTAGNGGSRWITQELMQNYACNYVYMVLVKLDPVASLHDWHCIDC